MKAKFYLFLLFTASALGAQIPEVLYYKFEGSGTTVPNLASSPPTGTATATILGNLTLGANSSCLGNGLVGTGSTSTTNYVSTGWNLTTSGSWTLHFKLSNFTNDNSTIYYFFGDSGSSFRAFTNGAAGANNIILRGTGMTDIKLIDAFPITTPTDYIFIYDSVGQTIKAYKNGVLVTTVSQTTALSFAGTGFRLGGYSSNTGLKANTIIDEFGFFNRAITNAEIQSLSDFCGNLSTSEVSSHKNKSKIYTKENYLMIDQGKFGKYSIFDISGRAVLSGTENSNTINISTLQKGIYIIQHNNKSDKFSY